MTAPAAGFSGIVKVWAATLGGLAAPAENGVKEAMKARSDTRLRERAIGFMEIFFGVEQNLELAVVQNINGADAIERNDALDAQRDLMQTAEGFLISAR